MAGTYRYRPDGMFDVNTDSAGYLQLPAMADEDMRALGYTLEPPDLGPDERLALGEGAGGTTGLESRADVNASMAQGIPDNTSLSNTPELPGAQTPAGPPPPPGVNVSDSLRPGEEDIPEGGQGGGAPSAPPPDDAPRFARTKAYDEKASWQINRGIQPSDEIEEEEAEQSINQKLILQERGDRAIAKAKEAKDADDKQIAVQARQIGQQEIRAAKLRQDFDTRQKEIDTERAAVDALKVDPDRIYSGAAGTIAKIFAGISIIAGGALMGRTGRANNPGLDAVNAAIDRDIALQKDEIANRRAGLHGKENELERLTRIYGSPELAEAELRDRQMSLAAAYSRNAAMDAPEDVRLNLEQAFADHDAKRTAKREQRSLAAQDQYIETHRHIPEQTVQVGGAKPKTDAQKKDERGRQVIVDGQVLWVNDDAKGKAVEEAVSVADARNEALEDLKGMIKSGASRDAIDAAVANINAGMPAGDDKTGSARLGSAQSLIGNTADALERIQKTQEYNKRERNKAITGRVYSDPDARTPYKPGLAPGKVKRE